MNDELKKKLAAYRKAKRKRTRLLKDVDATALAVYIDMAEESGLHVRENEMPVPLAYISRLSAAQGESLKSRLPWVPYQRLFYRVKQEVILFSLDHILRVLAPAIDNPMKYVKTCWPLDRVKIFQRDGEQYVRVHTGHCDLEEHKASEPCFRGLEGYFKDLVRFSTYRHW